MTSRDYYTAIKTKYPNTFIGLNAFYISTSGSLEVKSTGFSGLIVAPLDYMITVIIRYIEYRQVNFLEALCNLQVDYPNDNHETLRLKTVTNILHRLEKFITPIEGKPF